MNFLSVYQDVDWSINLLMNPSFIQSESHLDVINFKLIRDQKDKNVPFGTGAQNVLLGGLVTSIKSDHKLYNHPLTWLNLGLSATLNVMCFLTIYWQFIRYSMTIIYNICCFFTPQAFQIKAVSLYIMKRWVWDGIFLPPHTRILLFFSIIFCLKGFYSRAAEPPPSLPVRLGLNQKKFLANENLQPSIQISISSMLLKKNKKVKSTKKHHPIFNFVWYRSTNNSTIFKQWKKMTTYA